MSATDVLCVFVRIRLNSLHDTRAGRNETKRLINVHLQKHRVPDRPVRVTLTRVSSRSIGDPEQLKNLLRPVVGMVGYWMGLDRKPWPTWHYAQRKASRGEFGCEIAIESEVA